MQASDLETEVLRLRQVNTTISAENQRLRDENAKMRNEIVLTTQDIASIRNRIERVLSRARSGEG